MANKREAANVKMPVQETVPLSRRLPPVVFAWLIPGAGHFFLKRQVHGIILLATIASMFLAGILMQGRMFAPAGGDLFTTVMTYGGFFGDICNGLLYFLTVIGLGYEQEALPGAVHDYGTKFIVCAGLLNLLAMVDAYEIASRRKETA